MKTNLTKEEEARLCYYMRQSVTKLATCLIKLKPWPGKIYVWIANLNVNGWRGIMRKIFLLNLHRSELCWMLGKLQARIRVCNRLVWVHDGRGSEEANTMAAYTDALSFIHKVILHRQRQQTSPTYQHKNQSNGWLCFGTCIQCTGITVGILMKSTKLGGVPLPGSPPKNKQKKHV